MKQTESLNNFLNDLYQLQEAASLLESLYYELGPYRFRNLIQENFPRDEAIKITSRLERYFEFDDSE